MGFERYTDRARKVMALADTEAKVLGHNYIGTEHILLGVLAERSGVGANALKNLGISLDALRAEVINLIGPVSETPLDAAIKHADALAAALRAIRSGPSST